MLYEETTATVSNPGFATFVEGFEEYVGYFALICAYVIEIIGILVIVIGIIKSFYLYFSKKLKHEKGFNMVIDLGSSLSLGLTVKIGAEILKTVVIRTVNELIVVGAIILIRAVLAILIHWEIKQEKKEISNLINEPEPHSFFKRKEEKKNEE